MSAPNTAAETHGRLDYRWQAHDMRPAPHQPSPHDTSLLTYIGSHTVARTLIRARFSPLASTGQRFIVSGSANGDVVIYNVLSGQVERRLAAHRDICRDVSWHPHTDTIISSSVRKALSAFASMKRVHSGTGHCCGGATPSKPQACGPGLPRPSRYQTRQDPRRRQMTMTTTIMTAWKMKTKTRRHQAPRRRIPWQ